MVSGWPKRQSSYRPPRGHRVQHVGRFPIGALPGGTYQLRIRVNNDRQEIARTAFFTIRD